MPPRKRDSLESGISSDSDVSIDLSPSAVKNFFKSYVPRLELEARKFENDDPSIDLGEMCKHSSMRSSTPIRSESYQQATRTQLSHDHNHADTDSHSDNGLDELHHLASVFQKQNTYRQKLTNLMLDDLRKLLGDDGYDLYILQGRVPANFFPIIKCNNDNTPYVEFILKSDRSDESPFTKNYSLEHFSLSNIVFKLLVESARCIESRPQQTRISSPPQKQQRSTQLQLQQQQRQQQQRRQKSSVPQQRPTAPDPLVARQPKSSTLPLRAQQLQISCQPGRLSELTPNKRVLPPRSCKHSLEGSYRE